MLYIGPPKHLTSPMEACRIDDMLDSSPLYMSEENIKFYSTGIIRRPIKTLAVNLPVVVVDERIDSVLGKGVIRDILYDTLTEDGNHIIIIELSDGRIIKTHWSKVSPELPGKE